MALDLSANMNLYGPPRMILNALQADPEWPTRYIGFDEKSEIEHLVSEFFETEVPFIPTHGSSAALLNLPRLLDAKTVIHVDPAFWQYRASGDNVGIPTVSAHLTADSDDGGVKILDAIASAGDVCVVGSPNNPTGHIVDRVALEAAARGREEVRWIVDETYLLFRKDWRSKTCIPLAGRLKNVLVVSSLSKCLAIPGVRMGGVFCHDSTYKGLTERFFSFDLAPCVLTVAKVLSSRDVQAYLAATQAELESSRDAMLEFLQDSAAIREAYPPTANFALVRGKSAVGRQQSLGERLLTAANIKVRSGAEFTHLDGDWVRFCFGTRGVDQQIRAGFAELVPAL